MVHFPQPLALRRPGMAPLSVACFLGLLCLLNFFGGVAHTRRNGNVSRILLDEGEDEDSVSRERSLNVGAGMRYAAFGSGDTYGASKDLTSRYQAFPYLVDKDMENYADFSGGPNYPSACTASLIGPEKMYDVILLDFYLSADYGLYELAGRLRHRYPNALLYVIKIWHPYMVRRHSEQFGYETIFNWMERVGADYHDLKHKLLHDTGGHWMFPPRAQDDIITKTKKDFNCQIIELNQVPGDAKATLAQYLYLFDETLGHLSAAGHEVIAEHIKHSTHTVGHHNTEFIRMNENQQGDWGDGDACHFWFTSGNINVAHSDTWEVDIYDHHVGKYALDINGRGYFNITNPFENDRTLHISFLATAASDPPQYPSVRFTGMVSPQETDISPITDQDKLGVHIPKTLPIGKLKPGLNTIWIDPLQTNSVHPFRIVGASFCSDVSVDPYKFAPPFNS